jgi:hypothetical protein
LGAYFRDALRFVRLRHHEKGHGHAGREYDYCYPQFDRRFDLGTETQSYTQTDNAIALNNVRVEHTRKEALAEGFGLLA